MDSVRDVLKSLLEGLKTNPLATIVIVWITALVVLGFQEGELAVLAMLLVGIFGLIVILMLAGFWYGDE